MNGLLRLETGPVARLTLTRGARRNALSLALIEELTAAVTALNASGCRAVVLAGEGPAFSAGADFQDLTGGPADEAFDARMSALTTALERGPMLSFAAIHGPCMGAGLDLAMACDFRIAGQGARFALPAVKMGILYTPARLEALSQRLSPALLRRLLLLAEVVGATAAYAGGLATHLVESDDPQAVTNEAYRLATEASALPPLAQQTARDFLAALTAGALDHDLWQSRRLALLASDERKAALAAKKG